MPGAVLSIVGLATLLWGLIEGPTRGWTSTDVLGAFAVGGALVVAFLLWERHTPNPMLDLNFFRNPRFSAASGSITLTFMALMGMIFGLTQYLQSVLGFSPLKAGAMLIPMSAVMMVLAPMSARVVERVGTKAVVGTGLVIVSAALLLQTRLSADSSAVEIILTTIVLAVGMANVMAPATESIMGSLPRTQAGVGSAVNDTTRQMGGAIGVALIGSLIASVYRGDVRSGLSAAGAPDAVVARASSTVQAGVAVGQQVAAGSRDQFLTVVHDAFLSGYHLGTLVAACITLLAATGVFLWLPARASVPRDAVIPLDAAADADAGADEVAVA